MSGGLTGENISNDGHLTSDRHVTPQEAKEESRHRALVRPFVAMSCISREIESNFTRSLTMDGKRARYSHRHTFPNASTHHTG